MTGSRAKPALIPVFTAACAAVTGLSAGPVLAQATGRDGDGSMMARAVPGSGLPASGDPRAFLLAARTAVLAGRTGQAQEALERAETRLLDRAAPAPNQPDDGRSVTDVAAARRALLAHDRQGAVLAINDALSATFPVALAVPMRPPVLTTSAQVQSALPDASTAQALPPDPAPTRTYALLPGHWQMRGATYVWVPPDTKLRPVQGSALIPGQFVWHAGAYGWVPEHREGFSSDE